MQPSVTAVMLTADRVELTKKAVAWFEAQTYKPARLVILDTSRESMTRYSGHYQKVALHSEPRTIGALRNDANALGDEDIIIHWDSDDYSHPNRIAEQVDFLISSGAQAVGYNSMLFWRTENLFRPAIGGGYETKGESQAWLFSYSQAWRNKVLGTSLCYWRKTWEAKPFPDEPKNRESSGEDTLWMQGLDVRGCSSLTGERPLMRGVGELMMIARIHGGNFGAYDIEGAIKGGSQEWKRVPEWDNRVREILE